jgi:hypothetical protein
MFLRMRMRARKENPADFFMPLSPMNPGVFLESLKENLYNVFVVSVQKPGAFRRLLFFL